MREEMTSQPRIRGQVAVSFLVLMGFLILLVRITINVGQMALVRTETSNAADAGALAGASWMASGENEAAWVARKMWDAIHMTRALYMVPICPAPENKEYAQKIWEYLNQAPTSTCGMSDFSGCGPVGWLRQVAIT